MENEHTMKTYVALVRDHSGSMRTLRNAAANDYNLTIDGIKQSMLEEKQTAIATVVECGHGHRAEVRTVEKGRDIQHLPNISDYVANGSGTPLWDSVGEAISNIENVFDKDSLDVAFLVMVITDGEENASRKWNATTIAQKITQLQATDRWTFVFRVPRGMSKTLTRVGIPAGNIMEWEQTEQSLVQSTVVTQNATREYFRNRTMGINASNSFYADLSSVSPQEIRSNLVDMSSKYWLAPVLPSQNGMAIKDFCQNQFKDYELGRAYYQLTKTEKVQQQKNIAIREKTSGKVYSGPSARQLLGLPSYGEIRLKPGSFGNYEVYIQSTSVNRKLEGNTNILYYM